MKQYYLVCKRDKFGGPLVMATRAPSDDMPYTGPVVLYCTADMVESALAGYAEHVGADVADFRVMRMVIDTLVATGC